MKRLTRKQLENLVYKYTHKDYKHTRSDGTRVVLTLGSSGTTESTPLNRVSDGDLIRMLPSDIRAAVRAKEATGSWPGGKRP